ncbi:UDP-3-O-(3-hydroxymyristoyl)glucosamine N-acyltransferase [Anoxybacter fermentans]|uniref:UDP-3-O-acylglucosamine N-acyltransferase n=1 Tax=Anoxybacter fermentans TaxID=1323375 RepID=A0A3S9T083_9FIRM|nr:UDP-3-O-(3-hydroxymyristoyl)glucosamine N-acyltransferase [Anoxybacter fermentans]AZR73971.1 UDP-3-O-(3-hydroxymyristoyl)glucosamine N-acyltransferase [Anoxybacter fermentans]
MKRLKDLAEIVGGNIIGDGDIMIVGVGSAKEGASYGTITFAETEEIHKEAEKTEAAAVIVPKTITKSSKTLVQVDNPRLAFARIAREFMPKPLVTGEIHPTSVIHPTAVIGEDVSIHPYAVIDEGVRIGPRTVIGPGVYVGKGVKIGADCEIHANVVIEYETRIGDRVIIHGGTVLGSDGYGFVTTKEGHYKIPQLGNVIIEDDVEIGANVTIDRGAIGSTIIGRGTKIDNLVHLAHNVETGPECLIVAQSGIAGSTKLGKRVTMAGQSGVFGHLKVGDYVTLAARGVITSNVESGSFLSGFPAIDHKQNYKIKAASRRVPELLKQIKTMEKRLAELEKKLEDK